MTACRGSPHWRTGGNGPVGHRGQGNGTTVSSGTGEWYDGVIGDRGMVRRCHRGQGNGAEVSWGTGEWCDGVIGDRRMGRRCHRGQENGAEVS